MKRSDRQALFIAVLALSGSVLVLLVPGAVGGEPPSPWLVWPVLGAVVASATGTVLVRRRDR